MSILRRRLRLFVCALTLMAAGAANAAQDAPEAQRWIAAQPVITLDEANPLSAPAYEKFTIHNVAADIHFDPRDLDDSRLIISASFQPRALPSGRAIDAAILQAGHAEFYSEKITETDDNVFQILGVFRMNNRVQRIVFPLTVTTETTDAAHPALVFSGSFNAPIGQSAPQFGLPAFIPLRLLAKAAPAP